MPPPVERKRDPLNLVITGVGGQGSLLASQVLGKLLVEQGLVVTIGETLGLSQRGGTVVSQLRISAADELSPVIPRGRGHVIAALEPVEGLRALARFGNPEIDLLMNTRPVYPLGVLAGEETYPERELIERTARDLCRRLWLVDASELALGLGDARLANTAMLGALFGLGLLPVDVKPTALREALGQVLPAARVEVNLEAFERGRRTVRS
jgi:indolepyruvate ferredoxin oxidoreductase beta subunit